jgi:hypothetical protein
MTTRDSTPASTPPDAGDVAPEGSPGAPDHEDSLLDEALRETFPASDPIAPACKRTPGERDPQPARPRD